MNLYDSWMIARRVVLMGALVLCAASLSFCQTIAFTVSMAQPSAHRFHVVARAEGLRGETQDFKLPVWSPGYYRVVNYAKNVSDFHAADGAGKALAVEKVTRNAWRVVAANAPAIVLEYDVLGTSTFGVNNYLGENRAYISPAGMFVHPAGRLAMKPTLTFELPDAWTKIASGLDAAPGAAHRFTAADFDVLYDCPILIGNQEALQFEVKGVPHRVVIENVAATVDRAKMRADLKRMVEAAVALIGDVPYRHYTFLMMGTGNGGIEHLNSASISFNGKSLENEAGYRGWLSYVAHEYFHNFNVKRIRPIALGPFDYDTENLTNMLWVSEGLSVYYQDLLLRRAGLMTREQYFEKMQNSLARFENATGHHYQSATESSWNTWGTSGVGNDRNTTISYYDNGAMLGAMLDLRIRSLSANRKSLDDVMRSLYRKYYQEKQRGFTDAEFRAECEGAAGEDLSEVFEYASTTKDPDYAKYFALAGLALETSVMEGKGAYLGVNTTTADGKLAVYGVSSGSPAEKAGITAGEEIVAVEGAKASVKVLSDALMARKPGDRLKLKVGTRDVEVELGVNPQKVYKIRAVEHPTELQAAILRDWMAGPK